MELQISHSLCADAYRQIAGADIAFVNGGGIRADLPEGDITYEDILAVHPYGNHLCVCLLYTSRCV